MLKIKLYDLEEYGKRNSLEITVNPDDVSDQNRKVKVIEILKGNVSSSDTEACHRTGKSKNSSKIQLYYL